jgi:hypothetical protein
MIPKEHRHKFDQIYEARLKRYKSGNQPPWAKRKAQDIARSLAHPDIYRNLVILACCTNTSVIAIHALLIDYFIKTYGMSDEMAESWVLFFATGSEDAIISTKQIDGVRFYNDDLKIAGPSNNESESYLRIMEDRSRKDPHINIRIGRSATRTDIEWFISEYWDKSIEPKLAKSKTKQTRNKKLLRNSTIYTLSKQGLKTKAIQDYIYDDVNYGELVELSTISNVIKEFKPPRDWFSEAYKILEEEAQNGNKNAVFNIGFSKEPEPHFTLELFKDN